VGRDLALLRTRPLPVGSLDDAMRSRPGLERTGVEIGMGPGRHPRSTAVVLCFEDTSLTVPAPAPIVDVVRTAQAG
jgi:hypothetical protein